MGEYKEAVDLLWKVVSEDWSRFQGIELVTLMDLNHLIPKARAAGIEDIPVDPRFLMEMDVDVRVVLTWDADSTDMDLWIVEPTGEKVHYGNNRSVAGGHFARDFTQGYGPEEYLLKKAIPGEYTLALHKNLWIMHWLELPPVDSASVV